MVLVKAGVELPLWPAAAGPVEAETADFVVDAAVAETVLVVNFGRIV